ncbi:unnamed protein product [Owenia fusiformis]|uniref:Uncharacterized protein n=1 Tax=Owenia fusiformis TaxID=6347 RepID=A0A8J1UX05_OWEFU|nr:unnamed protein product [Owenia fusiformis]
MLNTSQEPPCVLYTNVETLWLELFAISTIMLLAIVGNALMCAAVYRTPKLRTVTNIFTINLAVTDFSVGTFVLPLWIYSTVMSAYVCNWEYPHWLCQIAVFVTEMLLLVSIATLAGISLDRYLSICHPLRYPMEMTHHRVIYCVLYIWIQSIILASTPLYGWGKYSFRPQTIPICNPNWRHSISYSAFLIIWAILIPLGAMLFSYFRIIQVARRQARRIAAIQAQITQDCDTGESTSAGQNDMETETNTNKTRRFQFFKSKNGRKKETNVTAKKMNAVTKNLKTLKTVFIVVGAFFICWGPYVVLNFWFVNYDDAKVPYIADLLTTLLAFSNSAVNPYVFTLLNRDFRYAMRRMTKKCCCGGLCIFSYRDRIGTINSNKPVVATIGDRSIDSGVEADHQTRTKTRSRGTSTHTTGLNKRPTSPRKNVFPVTPEQDEIIPGQATE